MVQATVPPIFHVWISQGSAQVAIFGTARTMRRQSRIFCLIASPSQKEICNSKTQFSVQQSHIMVNIGNRSMQP